MNTTNQIKKACKRMADLLDFDIKRSGRSWKIVGVPVEYLREDVPQYKPFLHSKFNNVELFVTLANVATAPKSMGGLGIDHEDLPFEVGYRPGYVPAQKGRYDRIPVLPKKMTASEEAVLRRAFPRMSQEEYERWETRWTG